MIHSWSPLEYPISCVKNITACGYVQVERLSITERSVPQNERRGDVGRAHAGRKGTERTVGAGMRISTDDQLTRCDETLFG